MRRKRCPPLMMWIEEIKDLKHVYNEFRTTCISIEHKREEMPTFKFTVYAFSLSLVFDELRLWRNPDLSRKAVRFIGWAAIGHATVFASIRLTFYCPHSGHFLGYVFCTATCRLSVTLVHVEGAPRTTEYNMASHLTATPRSRSVARFRNSVNFNRVYLFTH